MIAFAADYSRTNILDLKKSTAVKGTDGGLEMVEIMWCVEVL